MPRETSFTERLVKLQVIRLILAVAAVAIGLAQLGLAGPRLSLLIAAAAYLVTVGFAEAFWRRTGMGRYTVHGVLVGADGIFFVLVMAMTGGMQSPARYLLILNVIATTLLLSYRSGVRLTLWQCLLLLVAYQVASSLQPAWWRFPIVGRVDQELLFFSAALVAVSLLTATTAAFNERALRAGRRDLEVLTGLSRDMERVVKPEVVAEALCTALEDGYKIKRSLVAIVDGDRLRIVASRGAEQVPYLHVDPVLKKALAGEGPLLVRLLDEASPEGLAAALPDARDVVLLALRAEESVLGVLVAERGRSHGTGIESRVLAAFGQLAAHTALAMRRATLLATLGRLADTDVLTGLANRGAFDRSLSIELDRAQRQGTPVGLLIADIDRFKRINDEQGHPAGDAVLREVGMLFAEDLRGSDVAARYGGEEFAFILPGCPHSELATRAERLRMRVKETQFAGMPITLSIGAASSPPQSLSCEKLIAAADRALYLAKGAGRDRVVIDRWGSRPESLPIAPAQRTGSETG
ncbi:MAG: GGDEF domain-containing protein [Actinomycetota bacterium]|nr:GGDEF domain-containing protein [Actinomycetota bacterium]